MARYFHYTVEYNKARQADGGLVGTTEYTAALVCGPEDSCYNAIATGVLGTMLGKRALPAFLRHTKSASETGEYIDSLTGVQRSERDLVGQLFPALQSSAMKSAFLAYLGKSPPGPELVGGMVSGHLSLVLFREVVPILLSRK